MTKNSTSGRISKDQYYMDIAKVVLKRSNCLKRKYGCVIVKDDVIVSTGYNGSPRGAINCCDEGHCRRSGAVRYTDYTECLSVHAEQNALITGSSDRLKGATIYLACESNIRNFTDPSDDIDIFVEDKSPKPCPLCERMLKNAGIVRIVNQADLEEK